MTAVAAILIIIFGAVCLICEKTSASKRFVGACDVITRVLVIIGASGLAISAAAFYIEAGKLGAEIRETVADTYLLFAKAGGAAAGLIIAVTLGASLIRHKMEGARLAVSFLGAATVAVLSSVFASWSEYSEINAGLYISLSGIFLAMLTLASPAVDMHRLNKSLSTPEGAAARKARLDGARAPRLERRRIREKRRKISKKR